MPYLASRYFGTRAVSRIFGWFLFAFFLGATVGPLAFAQLSAAYGGAADRAGRAVPVARPLSPGSERQAGSGCCRSRVAGLIGRTARGFPDALPQSRHIVRDFQGISKVCTRLTGPFWSPSCLFSPRASFIPVLHRRQAAFQQYRPRMGGCLGVIRQTADRFPR
jgi:hypothetical protein